MFDPHPEKFYGSAGYRKIQTPPPPVNSLICITALYLVIARGLTDVLLCVWQESPLSGDKSHESRPSLDGDGGEETETAPEADDEVGSLLFWFISVLWIKIHLV